MTGGDRAAVDDLIALDDADAEAREVVVAFAVEARHFRRFPARERAAGQFARACDTFDHALGDVDVEARRSVVVQEQERFAAGDEHVVHAHRNQILADAVVPVLIDREFEFCADAVGAGDQHGLAISAR